MSLADRFSPAPREVRLAGALTALPGFAMVAIGVVIALESGGAPEQPGNNIYAEVAYYVLLGLGVLACAAGLVLGKTWARSPGVVLGLLLVGIGWYATGPSSQPGIGIPTLAAGALVVVLLFRRASRAWVLGQLEGETEEEAARRGGAEGRAARRERPEE
ncbi:hypothetical protein [Qaidamihabitans albus]|uniref:hypothetical protein n=1 Tax=Qaidamihabitans albus TaxID=2795733 RepID=UPI0018F174A8|nr:hypothetical protein [Qaidamihabitans albus]